MHCYSYFSFHPPLPVIFSCCQPNPDYFSALLWNDLVGATVLQVEHDLDLGRDVRTYSFCASEQQQPKRGGGAVTVVFLNTRNDTSIDLAVRISGESVRGGGGGGKSGEQHVYELTSLPGMPTSRSMYLNQKLLSFDVSTGTVPNLAPRIVAMDVSVNVQPLSYGFIVLPDANAKACGGGAIQGIE